ncbi:MAG: metallophosphoesterase family protein [Proteobacteria bacterium]|nr:metallophosphoesterase family protein [Pseudomonadota bacterium]
MSVRRLGVIGDVHAEHNRLELALDKLAMLGAEDIICTGDIVDGSGCPNASIALLIRDDVKTVRGNHDRWILENKARHIPDAHHLEGLTKQSREYLENLPVQISLDTADGTLLLCHGIADDDLRKVWPGTERMGVERSKALDGIIRSGDISYVVNGHMHFRTMIHFHSLLLINAGTLRGEHWPGFSLVDFDAQRITAYEFAGEEVRVAKESPLRHENHVVFRDTQAFNGAWDPVRLF